MATKKRKKARRTSWHKFVSTHRKRGKSMKQIAGLWKKSKHRSKGKARKGSGSFRLHAGHGLTKAQVRKLRAAFNKLKKARRSGNRAQAKKAVQEIKKVEHQAGVGSVAEHYSSGARGYASHMAGAEKSAAEKSYWNLPGIAHDPGRRRRRKKSGSPAKRRKSKSRGRKLSAYNRFVKQHARKGRSMREVARLWRKKHKKSSSKKRPSKKRSSAKKRGTRRRRLRDFF